MDFVIKANDLLPSMSVTLFNTRGPMDLTGLLVYYRYGPVEKGSGIASREILCTVVDAVRGKVQVDWVAGNTFPPGLYRGEFTATNGAVKYTYPGVGYVSMQINPRVPAPGDTY